MQVMGNSPWQSIMLPVRHFLGLVLYQFPCLSVDNLTESSMSSGRMTKEGEGRSVLWHVLVQACCSQRKEKGVEGKVQVAFEREKEVAEA